VTLGKGTTRKRKDKIKALTADFPKMGNVDLAQAFEELSAPAFALWLRISGEREALRLGRPELARLTKYSRRRVCELLAELEHKGYVALVRRQSPTPDGVLIQRRCVVGPRSGLVQHSA
jgi:hypothetical protein